ERDLVRLYLCALFALVALQGDARQKLRERGLFLAGPRLVALDAAQQEVDVLPAPRAGRIFAVHQGVLEAHALEQLLRALGQVAPARETRAHLGNRVEQLADGATRVVGHVL